MLQSVLDEAGLSLSQIDAVAFGRGPGAFTGVRLSVSVAQGIALGADLPVVAVSTLAALAQRVVRETETDSVVPVIDARMNEVYWGLYRRGQDGLVVLSGQERVGSAADVVLPDDGRWFGCGSGWDTYHETLCRAHQACEQHWQPECFPHAQDIALLGRKDYQQGAYTSPEAATPVYLRNKVIAGHTPRQ